MTSFANTESLPEATPVVPGQRGPFDEPTRADEPHPAWCDSLGGDSPSGCGGHGSQTTLIAVTSGAYNVTDYGAAWPLLMVAGYVVTEDGEPYHLTVEVTLLSVDKVPALYFPAAQAAHLAGLLRHVQAGSATAFDRDGAELAVTVEVLTGGWLSLGGALSLVLAPMEAGLFCEALKACAALPMDEGTFATWAEHRARVAVDS